LQGLVKTEEEKSAGAPLQPYLIAYQRLDGKLGPFFLVIDGVIVEAGISPVIGVDLLYKAHYVFNLHNGWGHESIYK